VAEKPRPETEARPETAAGKTQEQPFSVAAPQLSLPKGGGALRAIAEKFNLNPVTGTGSLAVPVHASPGRSGFGPQLSLSYDSGTGNGPFGFGWSLAINNISRKTDKGLPQYADDESDTFILSSSEDLVPVLTNMAGQLTRDVVARTVYGKQYKVHRYRPRIEGAFARIEAWRNISDPQDTFWRSISKDNVTTWYGKTAESRIADPADPSRVFTWLICESYDAKGNVISYRYKPEDSSGVDVTAAHERNRSDLIRSAKRYLKHIFYGNRTPYFPDLTQPQPLALPGDWCFQVVFDYGEHDPNNPTPQDAGQWTCRLDHYSTYRPTFEVRGYRLCQRVLMFHHFKDEPNVGLNCLVRSTDLTYSPPPADPTQPVYSFLVSASQTGYRRDGAGGYITSSLPPLEFGYSEAVIDETVREADREALENLPAGVDGSAYRWADLDGEGLQGILTEQGGSWFYKANLSPGNVQGTNGDQATLPRFAPVEVVAKTPTGAELRESRQRLMDLSGDGQLDLVEFDRSLAGFFERSAEFDWDPFKAFQTLPNLDWDNPKLRFIDLTGDGLPDLLLTEDDALLWHESLGAQGFGDERRMAQALDEEKGPKVLFADGTETVFLADMTGDGLTDIVRIRNGEVCYWPNLGYGRFGAKVVMDSSTRFDRPEVFDGRRIRLADIDGTGTADVIYFAAGHVDLYFNQSGNGFGARRSLQHFPVIESLSSANVLDLLGGGTACLVWSSPLPTNTRCCLRYIDLMGGQKPHLMVRVRNNMGAETVVQYAPSTKFYVADKLAGTPWVTRLPFPVHVVEQVQVYDYINRNLFITRYSYHHGFYDGVEREFRGFARVDELDTAEFATLSASDDFPKPVNVDAASNVPPVLTKTWYHTGAFFGAERISKYLAHEYFTEPSLTDAQQAAMLLPDTALPTSVFLPDGTRKARDFSGEELREACRALRGMLVRQEIYALDDFDQASQPYNVAERNYTIEVFQPQGPNRFAVFFTHPRESLDFHYERKLYKVMANTLAAPDAPPPARDATDPRVSHSMIFAVDPFGNVLQSASVGYGRRYLDPALAPEDQVKQSALLATCEEKTCTNAISGHDAYRAPAEAETTNYELLQLQPAANQAGVTNLFRFDELQAAVGAVGDGAHDIAYENLHPAGLNAGEPYRRLLACARAYYRPDDLGAAAGDARALLALAKLESLGLGGANYKLAFTPGLLAQVYQRGGVALAPAPAAVLASKGGDGGGYVDLDGDGRLWIPSGRSFFLAAGPAFPAELNQARANFLLPRRFEDPYGSATTVDYDAPHNLLVTQTTDPKGNSMAAVNDYRVLAASLLTDANANQATVRFDALGLVVATTVMGKAGENLGDGLAGFPVELAVAQTNALYDAPDPQVLAPPLLGDATSRVVYDINRFFRTRGAAPNDPSKWLPAFSAILARETHVSDLAPGAQSKIQISFSYSDGFGRQMQKKIQAEPGPVVDGGATVDPRWVGNGWTVYNNKGKAVRQYEPFFSQLPKGHQFEFGNAVGVSPIVCYDPAGRVVATLHANHSYEKIVFDPWGQAAWDVNDTVAQDDPTADPDVGDFFKRLPAADYSPTWRVQRSGGALGPQEQDAAVKAAAHANTPTLTYLDTLGRAFLTLADNGAAGKYPAHSEVEIQGNQRSLTDPLGRRVMAYDYNLLEHRIHQFGMETGERWMLTDALGKTIRVWDSRGHVLRTQYDELRRPLLLFVRGTDAANSDPRTLAAEVAYQKIEYGEGRPNDQKFNLRTRIFQQFDVAGAVRNLVTDPVSGKDVGFDFKGNPLGNSRRFLQDHKLLPDWSGAAPALLVETHLSTAQYDALNRVISSRAPDASTAHPVFNLANLLEAMSVHLRGAAAATSFVNNIDYNAKGHRVLIEYGDLGATFAATAYSYDPLTFRLTGLTTTRPGRPAGVQPAQALSYSYDPAGNITHIADAAQQTIYFNNQVVTAEGDYTYDPIYRLVRASGREQLGRSAGGVFPPWPSSYNDVPRVNLPLPGDGQAMGTYTERYDYDTAGNLLQVIHNGSNPVSPGWTRTYTYNEASLLELAKVSNLLSSTAVSGSVIWNEPYAYDAHGNMTAMPQLQALQWDFNDQLFLTRRQAVNADDADGALHAGERTYYVYNAAGQRVRKVTESAAGAKTKESFYLGALEIHREYNGGGNTKLERQTLHVLDGTRRIAMVETKTVDVTVAANTLPSTSLRFQFSNHLGTACLELDETGAVITYEEFYPFGGSSYEAGRSAAETSLKRYRYAGKERDEETGLYYFGARYYASWLGRWLSPDPDGMAGGWNLFAYCRGNPISRSDPNGRQDDSTTSVGITINSGGGVSLGAFTVNRDQRVVAFGTGGSGYMDTAERNTGLFSINIQDQITMKRELSLGRPVPQSILQGQQEGFFPGELKLQTQWFDPNRRGNLSPMFSGVRAQEALEGNAAGTVHFDLRGLTTGLTPPLRPGSQPGTSLDDFHSSSEARQAVAYVASTGPGERNVDVVFQHAGGVSTIPRNSNTVQGAPLPPDIAARTPNINNNPNPPNAPGAPGSPAAPGNAAAGAASGGARGGAAAGGRSGSSGSGRSVNSSAGSSGGSRSSGGRSAGAPGNGGALARSVVAGGARALGYAVPGVAEGEAALMGAAYLAYNVGARALVSPLMTAAEALPVAAGAGVGGALAGHAVRAGLEAAGVSHETATQVGFGAAVLTGAAIGSVIPGVGTAVGAVIGGVLAGAFYLFSL